LKTWSGLYYEVHRAIDLASCLRMPRVENDPLWPVCVADSGFKRTPFVPASGPWALFPGICFMTQNARRTHELTRVEVEGAYVPAADSAAINNRGASVWLRTRPL
jgi:hypothetical protein